MIKIVGDSDGGGSKRQMEGGGIDARKRATSMRRTSVRFMLRRKNIGTRAYILGATLVGRMWLTLDDAGESESLNR